MIESVESLNSPSFYWTDLSICREAPFTVFFEPFEKAESEVRKPIMKMCSLCPVQQQCLEAGGITKSDGVWGGYYLSSGKASSKLNPERSEEVLEAVNEYLELKRNPV